MSFKAKDLAFEADEPAFLRRLRGQARGNIDDPDRHINPTALSKAPKRLENDEDDAPTYVVEGSNNTMSKEEYENLVNGKSEENETKGLEAQQTEPGSKNPSELSKAVQKVAEVGVMSKKRKAMRVGDEEEEDDAPKKATDKKSKSSSKKAKSKSKTVKLSFEDDENV
jgi:hypothetical protein